MGCGCSESAGQSADLSGGLAFLVLPSGEMVLATGSVLAEMLPTGQFVERDRKGRFAERRAGDLAAKLAQKAPDPWSDRTDYDRYESAKRAAVRDFGGPSSTGPSTAFRRYQEVSDVNPSLWSGEPLVEWQQTLVDEMDRAIGSSPLLPRGTVLYRGLEEAAGYEVGDVLLMKGYSSTTDYQDMAVAFGGSDVPSVLRITVGTPTHSYDMEANHGQREVDEGGFDLSEPEFVLPRGTRMKVVGRGLEVLGGDTDPSRKREVMVVDVVV